MRPFPLILTLAILSVCLILGSLLTGSVTLSIHTVWQSLFAANSAESSTIVTELRLPRALAAFATGALLAQAGALMQVLVRNPLADPYILGVSGGAATAVLLGMLLGLSNQFGLSALAFVGAMVAMFLVFVIAHQKGSWTATRLLLTGVVIAAGWGAAISLILTLAPSHNLHGMLFWLMGDLGYNHSLSFTFSALLIGLVLSMMLSSELNVLIRGDKLAASLGINLQQLHIKLYILASLLTAAAVVQAGSIGFVGFIVPHLIRLTGITDHRLLLPAATLGGGILVLVADTLARTIIAPQQLPVGIITSLIGIPLFLFLLQRDAKQ
ncbi:MAG: iron ABC transporter permease [Gammaproteobacteria bacterium]|nr:iron ABC transporter permease [Gammaproteobacteria bacterium]